MSLPPFEPSGDLPEGLHQAEMTEFFARFGSGTLQRERVADQLRQAFNMIQPLEIVSRVIVWGSVITAKPDPADADILWVTLPIFDRSHLPVQVEVLFDPVLAKRLYGIDVLSIPEGSAFLSMLLDGLSVTRAFTKRGLVEVRI
jgi:hypothetical protein